MACPYFMPDRRLDGDWPFPQRLPLGAGWSGTCTAMAGEVRPTEQELKTGCNMGYAKHVPAFRRSARPMPCDSRKAKNTTDWYIYDLLMSSIIFLQDMAS